MISHDIRDIAKKYGGIEGVALDYLEHVFDEWYCWKNGKCDFPDVERAVEEFVEILGEGK